MADVKEGLPLSLRIIRLPKSGRSSRYRASALRDVVVLETLEGEHCRSSVHSDPVNTVFSLHPARLRPCHIPDVCNFAWSHREKQ